MTVQLEKDWLPLKIKNKRIFKIHRAKHSLMKHSGNLTLNVISKCLFYWERYIGVETFTGGKKKFYFKGVIPRGSVSSVSLPSSLGITLSHLYFLDFLELPSSRHSRYLIPDFLITHLLQTQSSLTLSHPLCWCPLPSLSCALTFSTHVLVLHFTPRHTPYSPCFTCFWSWVFSQVLLSLLPPSHTACPHAPSPIPWNSLTKKSAYTLCKLLMANLEIKCISKTLHTITNSEQFCLKVD